MLPAVRAPRRWMSECNGLSKSNNPGRLPLARIRELNLSSGTAPDRPAFLSAASGLVCFGQQLYVVADDELHLGQFSLQPDVPGELLRLFPGELPERKKKRKKHKPDLEILTPLPAFAGYPQGALLALGSGSGERRYRGALLSLNTQGKINSPPRILDASALFESLAPEFDELNLEGAWVAGRTLHLLQRGNKGTSVNAVIHLQLDKVLAALAGDDALPALKPSAIHVMSLGEIADVPLCFTDACALPDGRWVFSAIAEDTGNAYADGPCIGAAIGMADANHRVIWLRPIDPLYKIEGIAARQQQDAIQLLLVTDADDPDVAASLLSAVVS